MAQSELLGVRANEELREQVDEFEEAYGFENRSEAVRALIDVGLREQQSPILWRFKDRVVEWINLLSISAVVMFAIGATTDIYGFGQGIAAAFVMLMLACVLLGGYEMARSVAGMNEIGVRVRSALSMMVSGHE